MSQDSERMASLAATYQTFSQKVPTDAQNDVDIAHRLRRANDEYSRLAVAGTVAAPGVVAASTGSTVVSLATHGRTLSTKIWS